MVLPLPTTLTYEDLTEYSSSSVVPSFNLVSTVQTNNTKISTIVYEMKSTVTCYGYYVINYTDGTTETQAVVQETNGTYQEHTYNLPTPIKEVNYAEFYLSASGGGAIGYIQNQVLTGQSKSIRGTKGTRFISKNYPNTSGLTAETTKQQGRISNLVYSKSNVPNRTKDLI